MIGAKPRIVHVMTTAASTLFLRGQLEEMSRRGFDVHVVTSAGPEHEAIVSREGATPHIVEMARRVSPLRDFVSLMRLCRQLRRLRPDIVHAHTPKGGLLGLLAAMLVGVRVRFYHLRGLPLVTATGIMRFVLHIAEQAACALAGRVFPVSRSLAEVVLAMDLCSAEKLVMLGEGSGNGVDARNRYDPGSLPLNARAIGRSRLGVPEDALVLGYVGRIVADKGIATLERAWRGLRDRFPTAVLVVIGQREDGDPVEPHALQALEADERVRMPGRLEAAPLYPAMDVFVLPSRREGFPNVALEAAAMCLPVVTTDAVGCRDAVVDGETGAIVHVDDFAAIDNAVARYFEAPELRKSHGQAGRARVLREFVPERIWGALAVEYQRALAATPAIREGAGRSVARRLLDLGLASLLLVATLPIHLAAIAAVASFLGRPVYFCQIRPGLHGQSFRLFKLRTMTDARGTDGQLLPDAERLTAIGRLLRRWSIDELPQLWNVVRGDMSLVGPRPLLTRYLDRYTPEQARRHDVRPGITGWAQVNGRNAISWERRLELDVWYVDNRSLRLDLEILARTALRVVRRDGISAEGEATMPEFTGSSPAAPPGAQVP